LFAHSGGNRLATKAGTAEQPNVAVTLESISLPPVGAAME
jgi:hypothetical protein